MNTRTRTSKARNPQANTRNPASGFTLVELLIAMLILAIGLSAVVSVFYAAANLQQRAFDAVTTEQVKNNARAMITSRGLDETEVTTDIMPLSTSPTGDWDTDGRVHRLGNQSGDDMLEAGSSSPENRWPLALRAHPLVAEPAGSDPNAVDRDFYWVPLVRDVDTDPGAGAQDWRVYVFIVRKSREFYEDPTNRLPPQPNINAVRANPDDGGPTSNPDPPDHFRVPGIYGVDASYSSPKELMIDLTNFNGDPDLLNDYLRVGDPVLIGTGTTATVIAIDDDTITLSAPHGVPSSGPMRSTQVWFAPPPFPDAPSPTGFILTLGDNAVKP